MEATKIGSKITEARKKLAISQAQLAEKLFISPQAVGKWERGESVPDILTCVRLAKLLGVDLNYFSDDFTTVTNESDQPQEISGNPVTEATKPASKPKKQTHWDMSRGNWSDADFSGLTGLHEKFSSSNMQRCKFIGSELSGLLLRSNNIDRCDFTGSDISNSQFQNSNLANNNFTDCSLTETAFSGSHVSGCDFSGADLSGATVKSGGFEKCTMTNAVLNGVSFTASYLGDIEFNGLVENCSFENCGFLRVTFREATLVNTFFKCNKLKRIRFIDCKADRMTYEFLKNGKADLSGITLLAD